jgi:hypothetical protein
MIIDNTLLITTVTLNTAPKIIVQTPKNQIVNGYFMGMDSANSVANVTVYPTTNIIVAVANNLINNFEPAWYVGGE